MDATLERIDNSLITAYAERCSRFSENVQKLQEQIQNFAARIFGDTNEQHVVQEATFEEQPIVESVSTIAPQRTASVEPVMPGDIDIDALVNEIASSNHELEI